MTLDQLHSLTEDELALCLVVINFIDPPCVPKMEFEPKHLVWFRHNMLIQKLANAFPKLKEEGHSTFLSLMEKLGVKGEIKKQEPQTILSGSVQPTGSI